MTVLKFGAIWCNSCLVMRPRWEEIEKKYSWLKTTYFEYDDSPDEIRKYDINTEKLPTFVFIDKNDSEIERHSGELSIDKIEEILTRLKDK